MEASATVLPPESVVEVAFPAWPAPLLTARAAVTAAVLLAPLAPVGLAWLAWRANARPAR